MSTRPQLLAFLAAIPLALAGCQQLQCAEGTTESNGECVPANANPTDATCGPGTSLGTDGMCVPTLHPTECGQNTVAVPCDDDPSVNCCIGTGGSQDCTTDLLCPAASGGKDNICGRLLDIADNSPIQAGTPTFKQCSDPQAATDGPCQLQIKVYDAVGFAMDPGGATELNHDPVQIDDCGRFQITNIAMPSLGFIGLGVDDLSNQPDTHRLTGTAIPYVANQTTNKLPTYLLSNTTDSDWSTQANLGGSTFADRGTYMGIFLHHGVPVSGVTLTKAGNPDSADDYYFSDTNPASRATIDTSQDVTGANGSGLMINIVSLPNLSGTGGETNGCTWPSDPGASIPSVLFVALRVEKMGSVDCP